MNKSKLQLQMVYLTEIVQGDRRHAHTTDAETGQDPHDLEYPNSPIWESPHVTTVSVVDHDGRDSRDKVHGNRM
jgi:hypothetical protein